MSPVVYTHINLRQLDIYTNSGENIRKDSERLLFVFTLKRWLDIRSHAILKINREKWITVTRTD